MACARCLPAVAHPTVSRPWPRCQYFANLRGRPALVVGGEEGAAWKAELLAAAGALVTMLLCGGETKFCDESQELAQRENEAPTVEGTDRFGSVTIIKRMWTAADLAGHSRRDATGIATDRPAMALIDTPCHGEAAAFTTLARTMGITANAVDKPANGDFTFGSIVNRSPVVVGISTDGAAPILGQAIRQRIETLLPPTLAAWARHMRSARRQILARLPEKAERREFFKRFAEAAFRDPRPGDLDRIADTVVEEQDAITGHVTLVGAGPGDADLLTVSAIRALQSADIILFDALVSEEVLELARREARRMLVGKRAGRESCRQEDINATMLKLAREGHRVVRLKSGDPMIFGRAGEEIEALRVAGIPCAAVPGITAAQAVASSLGISLTHRSVARSLRFVTGHGRDGKLPQDLDWAGLANPGTTLVVYMGARTANQLARRLIENGLPADTPATAIANVTRDDQQRWSGSLCDLGPGARSLPADQPILIAVGNVFKPSANMQARKAA